MKCRKATCLYYDRTMTDFCSKGEPPNVEGCSIRRNGVKHTKTVLREEVRRLRAVVREANDYLNTNRLTNIAHDSILHRKFKALVEKVRP